MGLCFVRLEKSQEEVENTDLSQLTMEICKTTFATMVVSNVEPALGIYEHPALELTSDGFCRSVQ